jgi:hypothetical protein
MSGRASKAKGASFERLIRNHLNGIGINAENPARTGFDGSDVDMGFMNLEAKNHKTRSLPAWMRQAQADAKTNLYGVVHKCYGKAKATDQLVTLDPSVALALKIVIPQLVENGVVKSGNRSWLYVKSAQARKIEDWVKEYNLLGEWFIYHGTGQSYVTMNFQTFISVLKKSGQL